MGVSKAALGPEVVPVRTGLLLVPINTFDPLPAVLSVSHVVTLRLSMLFSAANPLTAYEFIASVSSDGINFFKTTINNVGVLTPLPFGAASTSDVYVRRFRPLPPLAEDFVITLNKSTPFIQFAFAQYGGADAMATLDVNATLS